jgi:glutamate synthase (NADPH/NADH) large chain
MNLAHQFKDNCGFGLLAHIHNQPSHQQLQDTIRALSLTMHRGAVSADGKSGDASWLLCSMPVLFRRKVAKEQRNPFSQCPPVCISASAPPTIKDRP